MPCPMCGQPLPMHVADVAELNLRHLEDRLAANRASDLRETKKLLDRVDELERKADVHQDSDRLKIEVFDTINKRLDAIEKRHVSGIQDNYKVNDALLRRIEAIEKKLEGAKLDIHSRLVLSPQTAPHVVQGFEEMEKRIGRIEEFMRLLRDAV